MIQLHRMLKQMHKLEGQVIPPAIASKCISINDAAKLHIKDNQDPNGVDATWLRFQLTAIIDGKNSLVGPYNNVDGVWKDEPCFLIGGSRGLRNAIAQGFKFSMLDGFHSIGINHVIEDYHDFEWLFFLDHRLIELSKYDIMREYKGRMFAHIKTRLTPSKNTTIFYTQNDSPSEHIIQGLYTFIVSGITAINLALISGANPIYLFGIDNGGSNHNNHSNHYKDDYTGEKVGKGDFHKFVDSVPRALLKYAPYADRFVNVDPLGDITVFKKMAVRDIPELKEKFA